ncbi:nucleotidyltransferase family protein [Woodsholea maritima]|uniref:nucleotidyltransferase family protein n=1 Tax=Woodsholea maritima TaxID=240237 RepID=UPI00036E16C3|nr:nucleotidyltransferase family protein [Woodsholea maritima]
MIPKRAMALAAGLGTRMRPLTNDRCKALVELGGQTLMDYALDRFASVGLDQVVVNVHHFADALEAHLKSRQDHNTIIISDERDALLETGGGLVKAAPLLGDDPIYVSNIDAVWVDPDGEALKSLAAAYDPDAHDFCLLLAPLANTLGYDGAGDFYLLDDGRLERRGARTQAPYVYAGAQILHPRVLKDQPLEAFSLNRLWDRALAEGRMIGVEMAPFWMHVGDPKARDEAEARLRS